MKKLFPILTHPLSLSLFITIHFVLLLFPLVPKYELKLKGQELRRDFAIEYYDDLDGNGYSDRILFTRYRKILWG